MNVASRALLILLVFIASAAQAEHTLSSDAKSKIDEAVDSAYAAALAQLPCELNTRGKPSMFRWEKVDRCLSDAAGAVDREAFSKQLQGVRASEKGISDDDLQGAVAASLAAHAVSYDKVFSVKEKDSEALLPLTNSLLKYLPPDSLQNVTVFDRYGRRLGKFAGTYSFETTGSRLTLFQYSDSAGNMQAASDRLLLDTFGVPWKQAKSSGKFRLNLSATESQRIPGDN